jgi:WXG100 family type VII secretion target
LLVTSDGKLNVSPAVLAGVCESLSGASQHLLAELKSLDATVSAMLAGWHGNSGGAYGQAYGQWLAGAREVESALSTMAALLGEAGRAYEHREQQSAAGLGSLGDG